MNEQEHNEWNALVVRCHLSVNVRWTELVLLADAELRELRAENARLRALLRRARSFVAVHPEHPALVDEIDAALGLDGNE